MESGVEFGGPELAVRMALALEQSFVVVSESRRFSVAMVSV
jgi:hypothetical protein